MSQGRSNVLSRRSRTAAILLAIGALLGAAAMLFLGVATYRWWRVPDVPPRDASFELLDLALARLETMAGDESWASVFAARAADARRQTTAERLAEAIQDDDEPSGARPGTWLACLDELATSAPVAAASSVGRARRAELVARRRTQLRDLLLGDLRPALLAAVGALDERRALGAWLERCRAAGLAPDTPRGRELWLAISEVACRRFLPPPEPERSSAEHLDELVAFAAWHEETFGFRSVAPAFERALVGATEALATSLVEQVGDLDDPADLDLADDLARAHRADRFLAGFLTGLHRRLGPPLLEIATRRLVATPYTTADLRSWRIAVEHLLAAGLGARAEYDRLRMLARGAQLLELGVRLDLLVTDVEVWEGTFFVDLLSKPDFYVVCRHGERSGRTRKAIDTATPEIREGVILERYRLGDTVTFELWDADYDADDKIAATLVASAAEEILASRQRIKGSGWQLVLETRVIDDDVEALCRAWRLLR